MAQAVQVFKEQGLTARTTAAERDIEQAAKQGRAERLAELTGVFEVTVGEMVATVSSTATELQATATSMSATAGQTTAQAASVAIAAGQTLANVQTMALAAERLSASAAEINRHISQSADMANHTASDARRTNEIVRALADGAQHVGDVVELISGLAGQTNLLALNASIEAARAGTAGSGFAVVAGEMKSLAIRTAKAAEEIARQIGQMQVATEEAVVVIQGIAINVSKLSSNALTIDVRATEQGAAMQDIERIISQAVAGTEEVNCSIHHVSQGASQTGTASRQVLEAASELSRRAEQLTAEVRSFVINVRVA